MTHFDRLVPGPPAAARAALCEVLQERYGTASVQGDAVYLDLGALPGDRFARSQARGRLVTTDEGVRFVGEVDHTPTTKILYGGSLVAVLVGTLGSTVQTGAWMGLVGVLVGTGALAGVLASTRAGSLQRGQALVQRLVDQASALVPYHQKPDPEAPR